MRSALLASVALAALSTAHAADAWHDKARVMLDHAVNIPTVIGRGKVPELAAYFASQFSMAGWPETDIHVMPYETGGDKTAALIVRWRAAGHPKQKPIMLMGHMDVVEAKREDWQTSDPFTFTEKDGYYYGRGTIDMKDGDVAIVTALLKLKESGFKPKRDIVVFFTGDEETNGIGARLGATDWHGMLDVEYGLNADAGDGAFRKDGKAIGFFFNTAEKTFTDFTLTARNRGGHSSKPRPDNAIYQLAGALKRLEAYRFEPQLNETTRAYFNERQKNEPGPLGDAMRAWLKNPNDGKAADVIEADESEVGLTRTRCVATMLSGGHALNALPQLAQANINCRIMPGVDPNETFAELKRIVDDPNVIVTRVDDFKASLASPLRPDVLNAFGDAVHARWPGVAIIPEMSTGASDARDFRIAGIPVYGTGGAWVVVPDDLRAHGRDERLPVGALDDNVHHFERMVRVLAGT
ncbi:MAG: M20/M25/M40 family metallo-hydrolase [Pseudomonadota bacterium]|nr:M20/M25/M40 family metallo-hydrolase [Pseudomonadota bacterium]